MDLTCSLLPVSFQCILINKNDTLQILHLHIPNTEWQLHKMIIRRIRACVMSSFKALLHSTVQTNKYIQSCCVNSGIFSLHSMWNFWSTSLTVWVVLWHDKLSTWWQHTYFTHVSHSEHTLDLCIH